MLGMLGAVVGGVLTLIGLTVNENKKKEDTVSFVVYKTQILGRGGFGIVCKGVYQNRDVAVKMIDKSTVVDMRAVKKEILLLTNLKHPNIIRGYGMREEGNTIYLIQELASRDLADYLQKSGVSATSKLACASMIASAMNYLHENHITHRDLKAQNILMVETRDENKTFYVCKVADFGLAKIRDDSVQSMTSCCGTPGFLAPEMINRPNTQYTKAVDVFSYGVLLFEIITNRRQPYPGKNTDEIMHAVAAGERPLLTNDDRRDHSTLCTLTEACWRHEPDKRPVFSAICNFLNPAPSPH